jgi:hypothetical protein
MSLACKYSHFASGVTYACAQTAQFKIKAKGKYEMNDCKNDSNRAHASGATATRTDAPSPALTWHSHKRGTGLPLKLAGENDTGCHFGTQ